MFTTRSTRSQSSIRQRNYADTLTLASAYDIDFASGLFPTYQPNRTANASYVMALVQNKKRVPQPVSLPKLLLTVHTTAYASFTIDLVHNDGGGWLVPLPKVLSH